MKQKIIIIKQKLAWKAERSSFSRTLGLAEKWQRLEREADVNHACFGCMNGLVLWSLKPAGQSSRGVPGLILPSAENQQGFTVVSGGIANHGLYLDEFVKGDVVRFFELFANVE